MIKKILRAAEQKVLYDDRGYRRLSLLTDWRGMKSAIGELKGKGYPPQPPLNQKYSPPSVAPAYDEAWFENMLAEKVATHPQNDMEGPLAGEPLFEAPLVGFVAGDDPIYDRYKEIIGPHHFTPAEMMAWQARNNGVPAPKARDVSVVSFILPLSGNVVKDNAREKEWVSERWAQGRLLGEIFSQAMVREIVTHLMGHGVLAVSPDVTPMFNKKRYPKVGWASPWSHRHTAYAAGLGTFGMHDFLITEKGCAMRCGSFVVNLKLKPNRERPDDIHAWCLHKQGKKCLKCVPRCPVDAIDENGHDKETCYKRVAKSTFYCNKNYHIFIYGCGLCATAVPCQSGIPPALRRS